MYGLFIYYYSKLSHICANHYYQFLAILSINNGDFEMALQK